ncbi:NAD(P)-dependent oxidoreductase [Propioniciclava sinopodophylli]|uniref:NAD(P)-dependent oxidoreductase n=1 Tax=Propioniciclava sinopodophylli TaxID=1837344 RepID=A0A4Q9KCT7_9ACTN|nr:NAD(P)-dependent oxidoreductase [Propioniciclava sinopodophylli]TBT83020.1 NAD(P)-dependent oxidoreductase [Propioniciclava sinopodophylli]
MRVLVIGGAGRVAQWVVPHLRKLHEVTTFDRAQPADIVGDAMSPDMVAAAVAGMDAIIHMAVVVPRGDDQTEPAVLREAWAINVGSWWVALQQGRLAGVSRFVYGSTLSVHARFGVQLMPEVSTQDPDSTLPYGFSKRVAEAAGALYATQFGLHVTALRLAFPTSDEAAPRWVRPATGEICDARLPDGTVLPAASAAYVAQHVERGLVFDGTFQVLDVVAPGTPWEP